MPREVKIKATKGLLDLAVGRTLTTFASSLQRQIQQDSLPCSKRGRVLETIAVGDTDDRESLVVRPANSVVLEEMKT